MPADKLGSVLDYVASVAMDPVTHSLLNCPVEDERHRDDARELIELAFNEPRPGVSDEQIRHELGL